MASIQDGEFSTQNGGGVPARVYLVEIHGTKEVDPEALATSFVEPEPLFPPYRTTVEIGEEDSVRNFDIPEETCPSDMQLKTPLE